MRRVFCRRHANVKQRLRASPRQSTGTENSVTEDGELLVEVGNGLVSHGLGASVLAADLELVELGRSDLASGLELANELPLLPASLLSESAEVAVLSGAFQSLTLKSVGDNNSLLLVVGEGDALEDSQATERVGTDGLLVWKHATDDLPENA